MIQIERTNYGFAEVTASEEEWNGIKAMVKHAADTFEDSELSYRLHGDEDQRHDRVKDLAEYLDVLEGPPYELSRDDLHVMLAASREMETYDVPGADTALRENIVDQMQSFHVVDIFDDTIANDEQLRL